MVADTHLRAVRKGRDKDTGHVWAGTHTVDGLACGHGRRRKRTPVIAPLHHNNVLLARRLPHQLQGGFHCLGATARADRAPQETELGWF